MPFLLHLGDYLIIIVQMARPKGSLNKKTSAGKSRSVTSSRAEEKSHVSESSKTIGRSIIVKRPYVITAIVVLSIIVLIYLFRGLFVVALVNGEPLPRLTVVSELEKQWGQQVSESLITQRLIVQEAREKNITATDEEINNEIKELEAIYQQQGQKLDEVLELRKMTRDDLAKQLEVKVLLDKLVGEVEVTDEEVTKFIEENNESYGGTLTPEDVRAELENQKFTEKTNELITKLQGEANIQYFKNY